MITASIIGANFVTVMVNGRTHTINTDHSHYAAIREALKMKDFDQVEKLIDIRDSIINFVHGKVSVRNGEVFYGDTAVGGSIVRRILDMIREGFDALPMMRFLDNLMANPSKRAVDELYGFLEATALPITEDGYFLAYKKVRDDYRDYYTGKMDNSVGKILEMPRNQVDDERDRTCSYGLHFCSLSYLPHYHGNQGHVMIVKINPADVVSIPSDYNNAKGRACRYEVIGEHTSETEDAWRAPVVNSRGGDYDCDCDDDGDCDIDSDAEYERGYDDGREQAEKDSKNLTGYKDGYPIDENPHYREGFQQGYDDHYGVDWHEAGSERGAADAEAGNAYDDTPSDACASDGEEGEWKRGYAGGWFDYKVNSLG